jgi:hypothetical protein
MIQAAAAASGAALVPYTGLTPIMSRQVQALIAASHGRVRLVSGYRTLEEQHALYDQAVKMYGMDHAAAWVADPAHSNHVKGSAADFAGDITTLHQLAPQFGLVAPMSWEPWHLEMSSTRLHSSPMAYTTSPAGETNPTQADFSSSPGHVAANFAESLLPLTTNGLGATGATGPIGSLMNQGQAAIQAVETPQTGAVGPQGVSSSSGTDMTSAGGANIPTGKGNVSPKALYAALTAAGFDPVHAAAFVSIAGRESGFNTSAHNGNRKTGDDSYGLWQINLLNGGWGPFLQAHGISNPRQALTTLEGSVAALKAIYGSSGMNPWGPYKHVSPLYNTNPQVGADASGGAVTVADLQGLG